MTTARTSRVAHSAIVFAVGLVVGGSLLGGPRIAEAGLREQTRASKCGGGNEVSAFVCRNTWMAGTRYGTR
jgi:hypothetical protein